MNFEELKNPELQERLQSVKTPDELVALAKEEGVALTDDQLEAIAGGWGGHCDSYYNDPTKHLSTMR